MAATNINIRRQTKALVTIKQDTNPDKPENPFYTAPTPVYHNPWMPSISVTNVSKVSAFSDNLEETLVEHIHNFVKGGLVVGCIAWLSNPKIIHALSTHSKGVLILVNDENYSVWGSGKCMDLYAQLPIVKDSFETLFDHMETPLRGVKNGNEVTYKPVRCIRNTGDALMHDKFLVFFKQVCYERRDPYGNTTMVWRNVPYSVWTGSMNMTKKASRNQENAVFIENENIATFYFNTFVNSFMQSAPLRTTGGSSSGAVNDDRAATASPIPSQFLPFIKNGIKKKKSTTRPFNSSKSYSARSSVKPYKFKKKKK